MADIYSYKYHDVYKDRFNPEENWLQIIPQPGRPLQSNELIELQSILQNQLNLALSSIYKNLSPIEGLKIYIDDDQIKVTEGKFLINGFILNVLGASYNLPPVDSYLSDEQFDTVSSDLIEYREEYIKVGIKVSEEIITEIEDPSLKDPIENSNLYGLPGAHRLRWVASVVFADRDSYKIGHVKNRKVYQKNISTLSKVESLIALFNYERNGNYIVSGLTSEVRNQSNQLDSRISYIGLYSKENTNLKYIRYLEDYLRETKTNYNNLKNTLNQSISEYNINPISSNSSFINKVNNKLNSISKDIDFYRSKLAEAQTRLSILDKDLRSEDIIDQVLIFPGVAYVKGYRIEKTSSHVFSVPRVLHQGTVTGAKFIYSLGNNITRRTIIIDSNYNINQIKDLEKELYINITGVLYQGNSISVRITVLLNRELPDSVIDVSTLIDFIINQLSYSSSLHSNIILINEFNPTLENYLVKNILRDNIIFTKFSSNTIEISSISQSIKLINTTSSSINIINWDISNSYIGEHSTMKEYQLSFRPVISVDSLVIELKKINESVVRSINEKDLLGDDSVFYIIKIFQGNLTFIENVDYILDGLNSVKWISSNQPSVNSVYFVDYVYTQELKQDEHYKLNTLYDTIEFISDIKPIPGSSFSFNYTYTINRYGYISIDKLGNLNIFFNENQSDIKPIPPADELLLCNLTMSSKGIETEDDKHNKILSFKELNNFNSRINEIENSIDSTIDIIESHTYIPNNNQLSISKIFNFEKFNENINHELSNFSYLPLLAAVGPKCEHLDLDISDVIGAGTLILDNILSKIITACLPFSEYTLAISSSFLESSLTLNNLNNKYIYLSSYPKCVFKNKLSNSNINYTYPNSLNNILISNHINTNTPSKFGRTIIRNNSRYILPLSIDVEFSLENGSSYDTKSILRQLSSFGESLESYSDSLYINVFIWNLPPKKSGFLVYLDGRLIENLIPLNNTTSIGSNLTSSIQGYLNFRFFIPSDLKAGSYNLIVKTHDIKVEGVIHIMNTFINNIVNTSNILFNKSSNQLFYTSNWSFSDPPINIDNNLDLHLSSNDTINIYKTRHSAVNQLFVLPNTCFISSIVLYYEKIGNIKTFITLRETILSGDYSDITYIPSESILSASTDTLIQSIDENISIKYIFDYPILIEKNKVYSISIDSQDNTQLFNHFSDNPVLKTTKTNSSKIELEDLIYFNVNYYNYRLLTSQDGYFLSEVENTNLIYDINLCNFSQNFLNTIELGSYNYPLYNNITHFSFNGHLIIPENTSVDFKYRTSSSLIWKSFIPNSIIALEEAVSSVEIVVDILSNSSYLSPFIFFEGSSISLFSVLNNYFIISNNIIAERPFNNVELHVEYKTSISSDLLAFISYNQGYDWYALEKESSSIIDESGLILKEIFKKSFSSNDLKNNIIFKINNIFNDITDFSFIKNIKLFTY